MTDTSESDLRNMILGNVKDRNASEETRQWLSVLDSSALQADQTLHLQSTPEAENLSTSAYVDLLFDYLSRYVAEFNKNPIHESLKVHCERPKGEFEFKDFSRFSHNVKYFQGHVSTREWAVVVQAYMGRILVFIVPTDILIGFRPGDPNRKPYMEIFEQTESGRTSRSLLGRGLSSANIGQLAKRIFGQVIKVARNEASDTEEFQIAAHAEEQVDPDRSYDADESKWLLSEADFLEMRRGAGASQPAMQKPAGKPGLPEQFRLNSQQVANLCMQVVSDVDRELAFLEQVGISAMKGDNMKEINYAMKRSNVLKSLKEKILDFASDWDNCLNGER
ncbi:MAG TPA: hypothetical protein PKZ32_03530 [Candidatus Melainabacteria bacterium]|nr:hypothetical protein [Candidatus Melainabacteria bacterium]